MECAEAGDSALNAGSHPVNKHRDPEALGPERKRNQKHRSTGLAG